MPATLIKNALLVNEGKIFEGDVLIKEEFIERMDRDISHRTTKIIEANGNVLMPGVIDDQVHFREPGLTHKGDIHTESRAAVAGGITSYMEMPNTVPNAVTQELLEEKYLLAEKKSFANFSFFMGTTNDNLDELLKTNPEKICGIKIFMGSSTGNMLVDNHSVLEKIFSQSPVLIATHCEDEATIKKNSEIFRQKYGEDLPVKYHPEIRSAEACYLSSSYAVSLAKKYGTRLHILHLSTARELDLLDNKIPLAEKKITAEACVHHLWFDESDYDKLGTLIKWNPAIKTAADKNALRAAINNNTIDIIATDHAPHTLEEKNQTYFKAPSGGPLVQHSLPAMLELHHQKIFSLEKVVEKMCHAPAIAYKIDRRGFVREGYFADLVIVNLNKPFTVNKDNILYKCGWSPFEGTTFHSSVTHTFVSGNMVCADGKINESTRGMRLMFNR
jgi:dihydroorotase